MSPHAQLAVLVLTNSEPDNTAAIVEALSAAVLPAGPAAPAFAGDTSPLIGTYEGRRGRMKMVIAISRSPQGLVASINGGDAIALTWFEGGTIRTRGPQLTFRGNGHAGPASELRFDTGGDHIILQRQ